MRKIDARREIFKASNSYVRKDKTFSIEENMCFKLAHGAFYNIIFFSSSTTLVHHLQDDSSHQCEGFSLETILRLQKLREISKLKTTTKYQSLTRSNFFVRNNLYLVAANNPSICFFALLLL